MNEYLSLDSRALIAESRLAAIDLGYDHISTIHFLIADARLKNPYSMKDFAFTSDEDFLKFQTSHKTGEPSIFIDSLPLTVEAEKTIKEAYRLWRRKYYPDEKIQPYHLFLAASKLRDSLFRSQFNNPDDLFANLENYYVSIGAIDKSKIGSGFRYKLLKSLFGRFK
jgi:hypothetical protein